MIHLNRQQTTILQILRQSGKAGMNSYTWRMKFIQLPVRIKELKEKGFLITKRENANRSVDYILIMEPSDKLSLYGEKPVAEIKPKMQWVTDNKTNSAWQEPVNTEPVQERIFA